MLQTVEHDRERLLASDLERAIDERASQVPGGATSSDPVMIHDLTAFSAPVV